MIPIFTVRETDRPAAPGGGWRRVAVALLAALALTVAGRAAAAAATANAGPSRIRIPAGSELRPRPGWSAPPIAVLAGGELPLVGLGLGDWKQVESPDGIGWVDLGSPDGWPPSAAATLARARRSLGEDAAVERRLGPFAAASDVDARRTWAFFDRLAGAVPAAYAERYGLDTEPTGGPALDGPAPDGLAETVVIFADEEDFRRLTSAGEGRAGQAGDGLAILYLGRRSRSEAGTTLVHELTHLLNRRSLGADLPPWLDEGLAEDMALAPIGPSGHLETSRLTARSIRSSSGLRLHGPLLHLPALTARAAGGDLPSLEHLTSLDRSAFDRSPDRQLLYAFYGLWVRYLIEDEDLASAFRHYLRTRTESPTLPERLGTTWQELDGSFSRWLIDLARRLDLDDVSHRP